MKELSVYVAFREPHLAVIGAASSWELLCDGLRGSGSSGDTPVIVDSCDSGWWQFMDSQGGVIWVQRVEVGVFDFDRRVVGSHNGCSCWPRSECGHERCQGCECPDFGSLGDACPPF